MSIRIREAAKVTKRYDRVSAFILCGGASSRMGSPKGLLEIGGQPLIIRSARLLRPLVSDVTVVGSPGSYALLGLRVIADQRFSSSGRDKETLGPLAGIATALASTQMDWNLILACDLPYVSAEWLDWLLARAMVSKAQILMPRTARGIEPLAAVYRRECAEPIAAALRGGIRKVSDAVEQFRIEFPTEQEWRHIDPDGRVLRNVNAPEDYEEARRWWEAHFP